MSRVGKRKGYPKKSKKNSEKKYVLPTPSFFSSFRKNIFFKKKFEKTKKMGSAHFYYLSNELSLIKMCPVASRSLNQFIPHVRTNGRTDTCIWHHSPSARTHSVLSTCFASDHQNLMWRSWVMIADRHTDSHKAFFFYPHALTFLVQCTELGSHVPPTTVGLIICFPSGSLTASHCSRPQIAVHSSTVLFIHIVMQ